MSTINAVPFRSTIFYTAAGVPAATGSVLTIGDNGVSGFTRNLGSTMVSIGASTNQTYNNFTSGSYTTWATSKSAITSANKTVQSANGLYQLVVANTTSNLSLSSDSGITWSTLSGGLPTLTGSAYWSDGAISANGQYITLSMYGGSPWMSADYGRTFALTNQPTPSIWLPLNGSVADSMGSSTVTATGSPSYVTLNYPGFTAQAVNLANTAGGTATRYVRGTWPGSPNFTVSLWFNAQSVNGTLQPIFEANYSGFGIFINTNNVLYFQFPNGGASGNTQLQTQFTLSVNTWYYVTAMFQTNGLCSFYVNNTLIASSTNTGGVGAIPSSGFFGVGTFDTDIINAFNGYVDDLRITHSVSTYVPIPLLQPNIWLPFENSTADLGSNAITPTVTGSVSYVPGVVGLNAVNLVNPPGGTPVNYISGSWPALTVCTVSGWFNIQSFSTTANQFVCSLAAATGSIIVFIEYTSRKLYAQLGLSQASIGNALSLNTWYYFQLTVSSSSSATLYLNSDSVTFAYTAGGSAGGGYSIGTYSGGGYAFNGYIDDIRIYNAAIPYHTLFPQNYRSLALSGTGQYALASAASGWVVGSSDSLRIWEKEAVTVGTQAPASSSLALNHTGQYQLVATGPAAGSVMPNLTGLVTNTWSQGGVNWGASASSTFTGYQIYALFNNTPAAAWLSAGSMYNTSTGAYASTTSTTILGGVGAQTGEWVQIQSSVPLVLQSYTYGDGGNVANMPKTYYIVGSNDGSTWFPLQFVTMTTNPFTTSTYTNASTSITLNTTGAITIQGNITGQGTSTAYTFSTQPYMYFRMVITSLWASNAGYCEFTEWAINFSNSVSYSTNYGVTWLNTSSTVSNESVALSASGQYSLSTNSVAPFARLTLDNTAVDTYGILVPTTGGTAPTYSTSIKAVGTHSAQFANTAGGTPTFYLNYIAPTALSTPSTLTMACWVYPSAYAVAANSYILNLGSTGTHGCTLGFGADGVVFSYTGKTSGGAQQTIGAGTAPLNTWTHVAMTYNSNLITLYVNGVVSGQSAISGNLSLVGGGNITNLLVGCSIVSQALNGYVDDVRIYTSALSATAISTLYNNPTITQSQIVAVSSSYLPITSYTFPALTGIGTATVVDTAVSQTGQYMVAVTSSTTNNVYYSTDFGATFTALTVGTSAMVSCSISYDGSYLTVESATTVHTLNRNTQGFTIAVGNQTGLINQAQNAIAIGNQAGRTNQSANSIVLNATGAALDAVVPGFYVAPVATAGSSSAAPFNLLGYGTDNQIVQSSALTVLQNGNMGIGTANSTTPLTIYSSGFGTAFLSIYGPGSAGNTAGINISPWGGTLRPGGTTTTIWALDDGLYSAHLLFGTAATGAPGSSTVTERMRITSSGNVGIGVTNPSYPLSVQGHIQALNTTNDVMGLFSPNYGNFLHIGSWNVQGSTSKDIVMNFLGGNVGIGTNAPGSKLEVYTNGGIGGTTQINVTSFAGAATTTNTSVLNLRIQGAGAGMVDNIISAQFNSLGAGTYSLAFKPQGTTVMSILGSGNVGIGTTNPVGALSVLLDGLGDAGGGGGWNSSYALFGPGANNGNGSCVGITYNTATNEGGLICITPNVLWRNMKYSARQHLFYANGNATPGFTIDLARTIYFGAYTANGTLSIVNATSGQVGTTSDRRIKENITYQSDTQQGLASVLNLKPATFNFIGSSDSHLGFIAQDLEQEIPMAVDGKKYEWQWEIEDGKPKFDANGNIVYKLDADGNKIIRPRGVSDRAIIATQTLAIQELAKQATSQSEIVQELTKKETSQSEIVQELAKKLTTAEQQLAAKSAALDALIAWAQTQGYSVTA